VVVVVVLPAAAFHKVYLAVLVVEQVTLVAVVELEQLTRGMQVVLEQELMFKVVAVELVELVELTPVV
jgi:hypothetical protein